MEYKGITWTNDAELCKALGKKDNYVADHKSKGESYEQIIDQVLGESSYRGITWTADSDLSKKLGK